MTAFNSKDYQAALNAWEPVIYEYQKNDREAECPLYGIAGQAALELEQYEKGREYLGLALFYNTATAEDIISMSDEYRRIDNLSKEMEANEAFCERFPDDVNSGMMKSRLFNNYVESENWEPAERLWPELPEDSKAGVDYMKKYLEVNRRLANDSVSDEYAGRILALEPDNIPALEYKAKKYYTLAEDRYQYEMEAYEQNKTHKQYARLIKGFEIVTQDFKTSLTYFGKLYELKPGPEYAAYLSNIYSRLDDKEKSEYYKKLMDR